MRINGFILAAGAGMRFRPLTLTNPKPLIPVLGKPSIEYSLEIFQSLGVEEVVINTHHLSEKLMAALGNGERWGLAIRYSVEPELLGTAGGFKQGSQLFSQERTTIILSGDVITNADIEKIYNFHREKQAECTIGVLERDNVTGAGIVGFDQNKRINRFLEKPTDESQVFSHWVNGSIYIVEPTILQLLPQERTFADFAHDLFPRMIKVNARFFACPLAAGREYLIGIDSPMLLKQAETDILNFKVFNEK